MQAAPAGSKNDEQLRESSRPAGRGWIIWGIAATLIGIGLGLVMSMVGM